MGFVLGFGAPACTADVKWPCQCLCLEHRENIRKGQIKDNSADPFWLTSVLGWIL